MDSTDLAFAGAVEQARLIRERQVSALEVVDATLARIDTLNPDLNAYRVVFADQARDAARSIDDGSAASGPLTGVPVAIKDDADVAGEITAWGTDAYGDPKPVDSDVVARLRAAGAIIIGKTNVPELTLWPWTSSTTWGVTRNPWDRTRTPGGSSGGSAVAAATGTCGVALGSDGGGSIRYPSACTGLFGIKPQRDRIPLGPDHHDAWFGLTAYGPLARSVGDAALFLDATADGAPDGGYLAALQAAPHRLRIAVSFKPPRGSMVRLADDRRAALERTADLLRSLGHDVFEQEVDYGAAMVNVSVRYLSGLAHDVTTMPRPERLEGRTRRLAAVGRRVPNRLLQRSRRSEAAVAATMNRIFERADVVLTPMMPGPPPLISDGGVVRSLNRSARQVAWASPWNAIGQPVASVPVGFDDAGLPLAVQLCGRPDDEVTLLRLASQIEAAHPARRAPET